MLSFRTFVRLLPLLSSVCVLADAAAEKREFDAVVATVEGQAAFKDLLDALPEKSLHAALKDHLYPKFKDGVFEFDRAAVENVHVHDPPLATALISAAAKLELVRRQNTTAPPQTSNPVVPPAQTSNVPQQPPQSSNAGPAPSSVAPPPAPTSAQPPASNPVQPPASSNDVVPAPASTNGNGVSNPPATTNGNDNGPANTPAPSADGPPPPSSAIFVVPETIVNSAGQTQVSSIFVPGIVVTSTDAAGSQIVLTTPAPTTPVVQTRTNAQGSAFVTTFTPGGGKVTSVVIRTNTDAQGNPTTITEYAIVQPTGAAEGGDGGQPSGAGDVPGLQNRAGRFQQSDTAAELAVFVVIIAIGAWFLG